MSGDDVRGGSTPKRRSQLELVPPIRRDMSISEEDRVGHTDIYSAREVLTDTFVSTESVGDKNSVAKPGRGLGTVDSASPTAETIVLMGQSTDRTGSGMQSAPDYYLSGLESRLQRVESLRVEVSASAATMQSDITYLRHDFDDKEAKLHDDIVSLESRLSALKSELDLTNGELGSIRLELEVLRNALEGERRSQREVWQKAIEIRASRKVLLTVILAGTALIGAYAATAIVENKAPNVLSIVLGVFGMLVTALVLENGYWGLKDHVIESETKKLGLK